MTNEKPLWKCVGCGKKTTHHGIPFTACETCQPIIENFVKVRKGLNDVFRSAVESQMREQFEKTIQSRIEELYEDARDNDIVPKIPESNAWKYMRAIKELEDLRKKLKEGIK